MTDTFMYNWARSVKIGDRNQVYRPESIEQLVGLVSETSQSNSKGEKVPKKTLKVLGSGMSFNGIVECDSSGVLVDLSGCEEFVGLKEISDTWATFGAGTTLEQVASILAEKDLQLTSCPGVLMTQTIAGALATGTHGQGLRNAGLYDSVKSLEIILANGTVKKVSPETDADFHGFLIHLGCLGILVNVTLMCEPLVCYKVRKELTDFETLVREFEKWNETSCHCKAWWFPNSDHVQLWRTWEATESETAAYLRNDSKLLTLPDKPVDVAYSDSAVDSDTGTRLAVSNTSFRRSIDDLLRILRHDTKDTETAGNYESNAVKSNEIDAARYKTITRFRSLESCVGNIYQIWCKGIPAPQVNCELAVPLSCLSSVLARLREYYHQRKSEDDLDMHYPFILRATGSSKAWLSQAHQKERICHIGFLVYLSETLVQMMNTGPGFEYNPDKLDLLRDIETIISENPKCVPHFGKFFTPSRYEPWQTRIEKWSDFKALVLRLDPSGIFRNRFVNDLFI